MKLILKILAAAIAVFVAAYILPGVSVDTYVTALIVAVVLGVLNAFIRPIIVFLTLPITVVTLGLFYFVINAALVYVTDHFVPGFSVEPLWMTLVFAIVVSVINSFLSSFVD